MTVFASPRDHLLTVAEYAATEGPEWGYTELQEGLVLVSPSPVPDHNVAGVELILQLPPDCPRTGKSFPTSTWTSSSSRLTSRASPDARMW